MAQLNLHIDEHFFAGKNIYKVETTNDGWVWVLGEDNFIARISPTDVVEDFTLIFATYSTKPFTDISSHMADTLLLGTDGDYAFLFANGNIKQYGPAQGLYDPFVTSVAIRKQYQLDGTLESRNPVITTQHNIYGSLDLLTFWEAHDRNHYYYNRPSLIQQNDRKGFTYSIFFDHTMEEIRCRPLSESNMNLQTYNFGGAGLWDLPIDVAAQSPDETTFYVTSRAKRRFYNHFSVYWAGKTGLNYFYNNGSCFDRSAPIPSFEGKAVSVISELHFMAALAADYLSYMLIGTGEGLYVSSESQSQHVTEQYSSVSVLGGLAIHDMESTSYGVPAEAQHVNWNHYTGYFCERYLYVATTDGLFKMTYSLEPASYEHVGENVSLNGTHLETNAINICGDGEDMLGIGIFQDANNFIQWQRNGQDIIGADTNFVYLTEPGVYRAVMWFGCENIETYSKEITVSLTDAATFTFDYPNRVDLCEGESYLLEEKAAFLVIVTAGTEMGS